MLIFALAYNHSDYAVLSPVVTELANRGHYIMTDYSALPGFCGAYGPKALVLVSDILAFEHAEGLRAAKMAKWNNIPVISMQHGVPFGEKRFGSDSFMRYHAASHFCVWGEQWWDFFEPQGLKYITGNPALDNIEIDEKENRALLVPQINDRIGSDYMLSLTIEQRANEYLDQALNTGFDGKWIVRPHPADWKFDYRMQQHNRIAKELNADIQNSGEVDIKDELKRSRLVVGMSTVIMEALAYGCDIVPVHMDNWPSNYADRLPSIFGTWPLDGNASKRIADVVEGSVSG